VNFLLHNYKKIIYVNKPLNQDIFVDYMFCALSHVVDVSPCLGLQGVYLVPYEDIQMAICGDFLDSANV
jgi:hypothetical protein